MRRHRGIAAAVAVVAMLAAVVVGEASAANAARGTDFVPGYIVSDAEFFDSSAMTSAQIQEFLQRRVPTCRPDLSTGPSDPIVCLKDYRSTTVTKAAGLCQAIEGGRSLSAAELIDVVARACGISQEVLLVTLQKETSLVTLNAPSQWRYQRAMGYACPDTGPGGSAQCSADYEGFFNQVYFAARQYRNYVSNPQFFNFRAGQTSQIQLHNNASRNCGTRSVAIVNAATAALYNYTPYVPNAASLNAGYGSGDTCSTYGNRNFYLFYGDWFGLPNRPSDGSGVGNLWLALGGENGWLGAPRSPEYSGLRDGGTWQQFTGGMAHWSAASGAWATRGSIASAWNATGSENGPLGFPTSNEHTGFRDGGTWQQFQRGKIHWSNATGAQWTLDGSGVQGLWARTGWENGALGYPATQEYGGLRNGGVWQRFQGGTIHWSAASGAHWTKSNSSIQNAWAAQGWENGVLGYPTSDELGGLRGAGAWQQFQGGMVHWSAATGAWVTTGSIASTWGASGSENGPLGYPTSNANTGFRDGGSWQQFQGGKIHWSNASGANWTLDGSGVQGLWARTGWENGPLGYPTTQEYGGLREGGVWQRFQGGTVHWSATSGAHWTKAGSSIQNAWAARGWENGALGYPTTDEQPVTGGTEQRFQGGTIRWTAATNSVQVTLR